MSYKANPIYIKEKWEHDRHCSDGYITKGSVYTVNGFPELHEVPCPFCARIENAKNKRTVEQRAKLEKERAIKAKLEEEEWLK